MNEEQARRYFAGLSEGRSRSQSDIQVLIETVKDRDFKIEALQEENRGLREGMKNIELKCASSFEYVKSGEIMSMATGALTDKE